MKRIVMDCRFAGGNTGLGRYTRELVTHILSQPGLPYRPVLLVRSRNEGWLTMLVAQVEVVECSVSHYSVAEQRALPGLLRRLRADLFFSPHFNVPLFCPVPYVMSVHDLILHRYPNQASWLKQQAYRFLMKRAVSRATAVIAVSEFTKREVQSVCGQKAAEKTVVILEGASSDFHPRTREEQDAVRERYHLTRPYFLYVGNAKQHKNVSFLLDAYRAAAPDADLILVMNGREAERLSLPPGARRLTEVPDADLPVLYGAARATVTASLYEGFGLPVVEAEACGCPVIALRASSIPEVASPAATLLEPGDREGFIAALRRQVFPEPRPRSWKWAETARVTSDLLVKALG